MVPSPQHPSPVPHKKAAHVLIVEDNILQRLAIAEWLRADGFVVLEAASADEASLILASHLTVDVVVTDIWMPGMLNGIDFARYIRRAFPHIHVVVVSGIHSRQEVETDGFAFFQKPYKIEEVSAYITKLISDRIP